MMGNTIGGDPFRNYFKKEIIAALRTVLRGQKKGTGYFLEKISVKVACPLFLFPKIKYFSKKKKDFINFLSY